MLFSRVIKQSKKGIVPFSSISLINWMLVFLTTLMINCYYVLVNLRSFIPTSVLNTLRTIADKRAHKTTGQHHAILQSKLTRLKLAAHKNWTENRLSKRQSQTTVLLRTFSSPEPRILWLRMTLPQSCAKAKSSDVEIVLRTPITQMTFFNQGI